MPSKLSDFFSSFGLIFLGVFLIFIFSVSSHPQIPVRHENQPVAVSFPTAGVRQVEQGGDLPVAQLPASQPTMPLRIRAVKILTVI